VSPVLALGADALVAGGIALLAAAWLAVRGVRAWRGRGGACACPAAKPTGCSAAEGMAEDLRAAAARAAGRAPGPAPGPNGRAPT
jgi:hypothetical protein